MTMIKEALDASNLAYQQEIEIIEATKTLTSLESKISMMESDALAKVSQEVDDKGKAKYSNDTTRKAAALQLLPSYPEYKELDEQLTLAKDVLSTLRAGYNKALREVSIYRSFAKEYSELQKSEDIEKVLNNQ